MDLRNFRIIICTSCLSKSALVPYGPKGLRLRCRRSTCKVSRTTEERTDDMVFSVANDNYLKVSLGVSNTDGIKGRQDAL